MKVCVNMGPSRSKQKILPLIWARRGVCHLYKCWMIYKAHMRSVGTEAKNLNSIFKLSIYGSPTVVYYLTWRNRATGGHYLHRVLAPCKSWLAAILSLCQHVRVPLCPCGFPLVCPVSSQNHAGLDGSVSYTRRSFTLTDVDFLCQTSFMCNNSPVWQNEKNKTAVFDYITYIQIECYSNNKPSRLHGMVREFWLTDTLLSAGWLGEVSQYISELTLMFL